MGIPFHMAHLKKQGDKMQDEIMLSSIHKVIHSA